MRSLTIALASFIVGAACMFLFGNHTFALVHPVFAEEADTGNIYVPKIRQAGIESRYNKHGNGERFRLDGVSSTGELFENVTLVYGGGAFEMTNPIFRGDITVDLTDAAANAAAFLNMFGLIGCPTNTEPLTYKTNTPIRMIHLKAPASGTFLSPYPGGK